MDYYYLLSLHTEDEAKAIEQTLVNIAYDVDDRGYAWSEGDSNKELPWSIENINQIVNSLTKENAAKVIWDKGFLPDPVAAKFAELLSLE